MGGKEKDRQKSAMTKNPEDLQGLEKKATELNNIDTDMHYADKSGMLTLCGRTIPPAESTPYEKDVTCPQCIPKLNCEALPKKPE
jgi:hypothetical protein